MMIALIGFNANAAMYIVGTNPLGGWNPNNGVEMELQADGTYSLDATLTESPIWFIFTDKLGDWDGDNGVNNGHRYDPGTSSDLTVTAGQEFQTVQGNCGKSFKFTGNVGSKYTFTFNPETLKAMVDGYVEPVVPTYDSFTVAGNNADIFGETWNVTLEQNDMTLDETDGWYKLVKENVEITGAPYTLYYKVAANHSWGESWGNPNGPDGNQDYVFNENGTYNLTFKFNFETKEVTLDVEPVQSGEETNVYIFGDVNNFSTAEGWDPTKGAQMTLNEGVYTATVNATKREGQELAYFGFTKKIADAESETPWDDIAAYRFGPVSEGDFVMTEELLGTECSLATDGSFYSIAIPDGEWTVTVNLSTNKFTINGTWPVDTVIPEPETNVYIFGDVNNFSTAEGWDPTKGAQMTLNEGVYTATVNATKREGQELAYFGFTKKIADAESETPWDDIAAYRFGPVSEGDFVMTEELLGTECSLATDGSYNSIAIPDGEWTVTVNLSTNKFTINGTWPVDTVTPEPETNVYIIGDVNNIGWSATQGVQMTLNEGVYTAQITTQNQGDLGVAYFGFTKKLAEPESETAWDDIEPYRFGPVSEGAFVMTEELLNTSIELATDGSYNSIAIPEGTWTVTVDLANGILNINGEWPTDTVIPEPETNVYIIGDVNNIGWSATQGVQMTLNEGVYTAQITTQNQGDLGVAYFGFTKKLAEPESETAWDDIEPYRFGPVSEGAFVMTEELLGTECLLATDGSYNSIAIPEGTWTVTVDLVNNKFTINGEWPETPGPEPYTGDVYIMGEVNDNGGWFTNKGVKMTRDAENNVYTATITTAGENVPEGEEIGYSYFSFTKQLAETENDWEAIAPYRFGAVTDGNPFLVTEEMLGQNLALVYAGDPKAFQIVAGQWDLTLSVDDMTLVIKKAGKRGDVNNDKSVTIADVTTLIDYLLSGNAEGVNLANANCNLDDGVTIADVTTLIDFLLSGNWPE